MRSSSTAASRWRPASGAGPSAWAAGHRRRCPSGGGRRQGRRAAVGARGTFTAGDVPSILRHAADDPGHRHRTRPVAPWSPCASARGIDLGTPAPDRRPPAWCWRSPPRLAAPPAAASVDPVVDALITQAARQPAPGHQRRAARRRRRHRRGRQRPRTADASCCPASNMKIVTAVTTLAALGPQARFTTRVRAGATPADIVLEGGGDPLLSTKDLRKLANATAKVLPAGTPVVVHVDDDLLPRHRPGTRLDPLVHPLRRVVGRGARPALGLQPRPQRQRGQGLRAAPAAQGHSRHDRAGRRRRRGRRPRRVRRGTPSTRPCA